MSTTTARDTVRRTRSTQQDRLLAEERAARAALEQCPAAGLLPSSERDGLVARYSRALRDLVRHALGADTTGDAAWSVPEESWHWDGDPAGGRFCFHYDGSVRLRFPGDSPASLGRPVFVSARMEIDPLADLHDEVARLAQEGARYRAAVDQIGAAAPGA